MRVPIIAGIAVLAVSASFARGQGLGTDFTYQGQLKLNGSAASGLYDMRFSVYREATGASPIEGPICVNDVGVSGGLFTVRIDFGAVFSGTGLFLEIEVRANTGLDCSNATGFVILAPRQALTATPNALFATTADTANNANFLGSQPALFYRNASNLSSGTLDDARLSSNVTFLDREQVFTDEKHFAARPTFDAPTIPFTVESTGRVMNLNADLLDGMDSTALLQWQVVGSDIFNTNPGRVRIGEGNAVSLLSVFGGLHLVDVLDEDVVIETGNIYIRHGDTHAVGYHYGGEPDVHEFFAGGAHCMTMASGGNIGLGTPDPSAMLHLRPRLDQTTMRMEGDRYAATPDSASASNATVTQIAGTGAAWSNPAFAGSLNGVSASATLISPGDHDESVELDFRNLGFAVPANATIRSVQVQVTGSHSGGCSGCMGGYARLDFNRSARLANGATLGAPRTGRSTNVSASLGNANDTWGLALTPAIVNSASFGVRLRIGIIPVTTYTDIVHPYGAATDCSCAANVGVMVDGITVTIGYGSPTLMHTEYTVGIGPEGVEFRISPSADFSANGFTMNQNGLIEMRNVSGNGQVLNVYGAASKPGGGSWGTTSDARLKQCIMPLEGTLDQLLSLHGYSFEYTEEAVARKRGLPGRQMGLIAQEVEAVFPDWVDYGEDGFRMVTERATTALMIEALRDLRAEKDAAIASQEQALAVQETRMCALAAENAALRARLERIERIVAEQMAGK